MNRQVLCIWLPNWPCQRVAAAMQLSGLDAADLPPAEPRPFVLQIHDPRRGLRVAAADPLARRHKLRPGMPLGEAVALLPEVLVLAYEPEADRRGLESLADHATRFSPLVGVEATEDRVWVGRHLGEPQAILADVTHLTHFFGGPEAMARAAVAWTLARGYLSAAAVAPSVGAAWAAANYAVRDAVAAAMLEHRIQMGVWKIQPPPQWLDRLTCVWSTDSLQPRLDPLNIAALRLDAATCRDLSRLGVATIGALRRLPRGSLAARFDRRLLDRLDAASGVRQEMIACHHAGPEFYVDLALEVPTDRRETIEEILRRLTDQLVARLRQHGQGALRILCRIGDAEGGPPRLLRLGLFRATAEAPHLQRLLQTQLERHAMRPRPVSAVSLQAEIVAPLRWRQADLFTRQEENYRDLAARLIDVLASRLGTAAVVQTHCRCDPLPELASACTPLTGNCLIDPGEGSRRRRGRATAGAATASSESSTAAVAAAPVASEPLRRPLCLLDAPVQLDVLAVHPDGPPARFRWAGRLERVVRHWGPERIETAWWAGATQRRDYYRVETEGGLWLWLYRDLREYRWYLHGEFA